MNRTEMESGLLEQIDYERQRAERAEAERDRLEAEIERLTGASQCFTCGGPATEHWCALHRPALS